MAQGESLSAFLVFDSIAKLKPARSGGLWMIRQRDDPCAGFLFHYYSRPVTWNTVYMAAVIERLRAEGKTVNEADNARLSPARYEHINPYAGSGDTMKAPG
jgi:Tn3 transposase DDE domain